MNQQEGESDSWFDEQFENIDKEIEDASKILKGNENRKENKI